MLELQITPSSLLRLLATKAPLLIVLCFVSIVRAQAPREIAQYASPSVVVLVTETSKGKVISLGSGFFVKDDVIATNNHVIKGAARVFAKIVGRKDVYQIERVLATDNNNDLALLKIVGIKAPPLLLGNSNQVAVGDEIYAVGNPEGLEGTFSQGNISGIRQINGIRYLQITAPISPGSSGGPILNKAGAVIGVAVAVLKVGQNINFGVPVSKLKALLSNTIGGGEFAEGNETRSDEKLVFQTPPCPGEVKLTKEYRAHPKSPEAVFNLAKEFRKCFRYKDAAAAYELLVTLLPDNPQAYYGLGDSYDGACGWSKDVVRKRYYCNLSIGAFKKAIALKPDYVEAHVGLGEAYLDIGRPNDAIEAYKLAIDIQPDYALAYHRLAFLYYLPAKKQQYEIDREQLIKEYGKSLRTAIVFLEKTVQLKPVDYNARATLSDAYALLGQLDKAIEIARETIRISNNTNGQLELLSAYSDAKRLAEGLEEFKQIVRNKPDDDQAHYCLGQIYLDLGDRRLALEEFKILKNLKSEIWAQTLFDAIYR